MTYSLKKKVNFNYPSIGLILFLILICQQNIGLKIISLLLFLLLCPKIGYKISFFSRFYVSMILYHCIIGGCAVLILGLDYFLSFWMVLFFWILSYLVYNFVDNRIETLKIKEIEKGVVILFKFIVFVTLIQLINTMFVWNTINPYSISAAAGDRMTSIFNNSSVNMIVLSFFFLYFIYNRQIKYSIISFISLGLATYMAGTVILIFSFIIGVFLFSNIKLRLKIYSVLLITCFIGLLLYISPNNYNYAMGYIERIIENGKDVPFKIKSFIQTYNHIFSSIKNFFFGSGGGNFSSRVAFITSCDYVTWYPQELKYISQDFLNNHFSIWVHDFNNIWDNRNNTANQPFSFYNRIFGEYGILGFLFFLIFYLGVFIKNWKNLTFSKFMILSLLLYFVLDYWFEYFSVIIIFEFFVRLDIKKQKRISLNNKVWS